MRLSTRPSLAVLAALAALFFAIQSGAFARGTSRPKPIVNIEVKEVASPGGAVQPDTLGEGTADCPPGWGVLSGGFVVNGSITINVTSSQPSPDGRGWHISVANPPLGQRGEVHAIAWCERVHRS
jgi:hypothetical protein